MKHFIRSHGLLRAGERVLVGYSGGPDSTCLLLLLREFWPATAAVYVNHGLRGKESEQEEEFVRTFCNQRDIPLFVERISWKKKPSNLEESARRRRYRHLAKVAAEHGFQKIALAHHKDDVVETFLLRLIRGAGPRGLTGLRAQRDLYIRPLLDCSRKQILEYLARRKVSFFQDSSNLEPAFQRNRIRNELIPLLEQFNPAFPEAVFRTTQWLNEQNQLLTELMTPYEKLIQPGKGTLKLPRAKVQALSLPLRKAVLSMALQKSDPSLLISSRALYRLIQSIDRGKNLELAGYLKIRTKGKSVEILPKQSRVGYFEMDVPAEGRYFFPPGNIYLNFIKSDKKAFSTARNVAFLDFEKASFPFYVRNWKKGDSFQPLGMAGKKKLSDFWIDRKVPSEDRKKIALVFKDDDLVWVAGHAIHNRYKITPETKKVLRIEMNSNRKGRKEREEK